MPTSLVTAAWSAAIAACLVLALQNLLVWLGDRTARAHLFFAMAAAATAAGGVCELLMMRAGSPERYALLARWAHIPFLILFASLVWFVRLYLDAGRLWLAWTAIGTRAFATLVLNFLSPVNISYVSILRLRAVPFLGETVAVPDGIENPWVRVGELSSLLLLAYLVDAAATVWRRGDRRRALTVVGSMIFFIIVAATHAALLHAGKVYKPYIVLLSFLGIILAMGYELNADILRSRELARKLDFSETELQESEKRMTLAAKAASIGAWVWDIANDDVWFSATARAIRGFGDSGRITFARLLDTVHPDDRGGVRESIERSLQEGIEFEREYRILRPDGQPRWVATRGAVERDVTGAALRMHGVSLDVTQKKAAEMELAQQRTELAHLSRVTMLGELSGSLAHELNQPLTAILSNAQAAQQLLAVDAPNLGEVSEILADIVAEDKRAGEVIRRLRLMLRKGEVRQQPLDLPEVVEDVLKIVRSDLVHNGVTVIVEPTHELPAIIGDRVQLQQVLLNFVVNASDAMADTSSGERRLYVRTERSADGGVNVSVADRGHGIPDEKLDGIFEPFFTTKAHGMGLGLAVCRTIITAHGGRIWATNNVPDSAGATLHFSLPPTTGQP